MTLRKILNVYSHSNGKFVKNISFTKDDCHKLMFNITSLSIKYKNEYLLNLIHQTYSDVFDYKFLKKYGHKFSINFTKKIYHHQAIIDLKNNYDIIKRYNELYSSIYMSSILEELLKYDDLSLIDFISKVTLKNFIDSYVKNCNYTLSIRNYDRFIKVMDLKNDTLKFYVIYLLKKLKNHPNIKLLFNNLVDYLKQNKIDNDEYYGNILSILNENTNIIRIKNVSPTIPNYQKIEDLPLFVDKIYIVMADNIVKKNK